MDGRIKKTWSKSAVPKTWTAKTVRQLRKAVNESQEEFAKRFRLGVGSVRAWEQDLGGPSGPATIILDQIAAEHNFTPEPELAPPGDADAAIGAGVPA